uniref:Uncharacterized protein n=1 Tax=Branchiostoma floridae TaxID=7739 RepID=C3ZK30_BRAFL|eukprot:XP_002591117.1 hypothetical protein BRAFLDRAFT_109630 [Branchiostoma floridae]
MVTLIAHALWRLQRASGVMVTLIAHALWRLQRTGGVMLTLIAHALWRLQRTAGVMVTLIAHALWRLQRAAGVMMTLIALCTRLIHQTCLANRPLAGLQVYNTACLLSHRAALSERHSIGKDTLCIRLEPFHGRIQNGDWYMMWRGKAQNKLSSFARLQRGGILSSPVCPAFCCSVNVSCHYTYDIHLKPRCACADSGNGTNTCSVPGSSDMSWMPVLQRPPWVQGTCMGSWTERESDNITGLKLHCHVDQVDDFTFTVVHWNVTPPGGAFPFRPCIVFVHVNNTEPAHYVKTTVDIVIQYFGFGLIFLFIGVIMSSCKNIKA